MHQPLAYTYDADVHCEGCTRARFDGSTLGVDSEGNNVGVIMPWQEWADCSYGARDHLTCGDCHAVLAVAGPTDGTVEDDAASQARSDASWYEIGSEEDAASVLRMIEDGDPAFETPNPLSGEWADGLTASEVADRFGVWADDDDFDSIIDRWEMAYQEAYVAEVERMARDLLTSSAHLDRFDVAEAYAVYCHYFNDAADDYIAAKRAQLRRIAFSGRPSLSYSTLNPNALGIYLGIVARRHAAI